MERCGVVLAISVAGTPMYDSTGVEWVRPVPVGAQLYDDGEVEQLLAECARLREMAKELAENVIDLAERLAFVCHPPLKLSSTVSGQATAFAQECLQRLGDVAATTAHTEIPDHRMEYAYFRAGLGADK